MQEKQEQLFIWKRKFFRFVALFLVLYAIADVTVLQEYCGNELVGIPSYTQQLRSEKNKTEVLENTQSAFKNSDLLPPEQTPGLPDSEGDCFCCAFHMLLGSSPMKSETPTIVVKASVSNFSLKYRQSRTHLRLIYQPPKFA